MIASCFGPAKEEVVRRLRISRSASVWSPLCVFSALVSEFPTILPLGA